MGDLMIHINLVIGGLGTTVYALWAVKWWHRGSKRLFILNALAAAGLAAFSAIYAIFIFDPGKAIELGPGGLRYLVPLIIGAPIAARIIEFRRDHQREVYAKDVVRNLRSAIDDPT
jgi:hypothetical protein